MDSFVFDRAHKLLSNDIVIFSSTTEDKTVYTRYKLNDHLTLQELEQMRGIPVQEVLPYHV